MLGTFLPAHGYHPLIAGSSAINAGNPATCLSTDQRGVARPQGSHCDIGAYEFAPNIDVDIMIGAYRMGTYPVYPNPSLIKNYLNKVNGPVKVKSTNGAKIFTSQRAYYGNSYNELMGYPSNKFTTEYWFPWYDHVYMQTWILVGNPGINYQTAYVDIYIGGVKRNNTSGGVPYAIQPSDRVTPVFPGVLDGPV